MESVRLDVRLDPDRLRRLREMAATYDMPVSELVRRLIDEAYEADLMTRRRQAALEIGNLAVEDVPDVETLIRQLEEAHELGGVH